jgi:hypothetical protein
MFKCSFRSLIWLGAFVTATMTLLMPADEAAAQKKAKEPQSLSDQQLVESIHLLHSVRKTLEMADHDYGGHRADAVRDISAASKQLKLALEFVHKGKTTGAKKDQPKKGKTPMPTPMEPQALSDMQLASSVPTLRATVALLQKANHDYGGHRAKAVTDLELAIRQLDAALKFSKAKDQGKTGA